MIKIFKCSYCEFIAGTSGEVSTHENICRSNPKFARENELLELQQELKLQQARIERELAGVSCRDCQYFREESSWDDCWTECRLHNTTDEYYQYGCDDFRDKRVK